MSKPFKRDDVVRLGIDWGEKPPIKVYKNNLKDLAQRYYGGGAGGGGKTSFLYDEIAKFSEDQYKFLENKLVEKRLMSRDNENIAGIESAKSAYPHFPNPEEKICYTPTVVHLPKLTVELHEDGTILLSKGKNSIEVTQFLLARVLGIANYFKDYAENHKQEIRQALNSRIEKLREELKALEKEGAALIE